MGLYPSSDSDVPAVLPPPPPLPDPTIDRQLENPPALPDPPIEELETTKDREPYSPLLVRGNHSAYVRKFQAMLRKAAGCDVTGIFDRKTESSTKQFQVANGLAVTGTATPETWNKLRELIDG